MLRGFLKAAVALAIGSMATLGSCAWFAVHPGPVVMSNGRLIGELLTPFALGLLIGAVVYRLLDR